MPSRAAPLIAASLLAAAGVAVALTTRPAARPAPPHVAATATVGAEPAPGIVALRRQVADERARALGLASRVAAFRAHDERRIALLDAGGPSARTQPPAPPPPAGVPLPDAVPASGDGAEAQALAGALAAARAATAAFERELRALAAAPRERWMPERRWLLPAAVQALTGAPGGVVALDARGDIRRLTLDAGNAVTGATPVAPGSYPSAISTPAATWNGAAGDQLAASVDGRSLLVAGAGGVVVLDATTLRPQRAAVAATPPAIWLADGAVAVLRGRTPLLLGRDVHELAPPLDDDVVALAARRDGGAWCALDRGGELQRRSADGTLLGRDDLGQAAPRACAWSPDGAVIAVGFADGGIALLDAASGRRLPAPTGHRAAVTLLAWGGDGTLVSAAGPELRAWRAGDRRCCGLATLGAPVQQLVALPAGDRLAAAAIDATRVLALPRLEIVAQLRSAGGGAAACSAAGDGQILIAEGARRIALWRRVAIDEPDMLTPPPLPVEPRPQTAPAATGADDF